MNLLHKKFKEELKKRQITEILTLLLSEETHRLCRKLLYDYIKNRNLVLHQLTFLIYKNDQIQIQYEPRNEVFSYVRLYDGMWTRHAVKIEKHNEYEAHIINQLIKSVNEGHEY